MKKLKVALGIPLLAISLTACSDNASETTTEKESSSEKSTAVHSKENSSKTAKKEATPSKLQTKASTIQKAINSKEVDRDYILNVMDGYRYIQVGNNQYIYYGINQKQNIFSMMEVNFDASGDYVQTINFIDNASEEQIALLQNQVKEQQEQLSELEQQQIEKELDDYYIKQEQERQKAEEAQAKADEEAKAEADRKVEEKRLAEEEKKQQEEEAAQAKVETEAGEDEGSLDEGGWVDVEEPEPDVQAEQDGETDQENPDGQEPWEDVQGIDEAMIDAEEASKLIYQELGLPEDTDTLVTYHGQDATGLHVFEVSNFVVDNEETGEGHDELVGWYTVESVGGKVTKN